MKLQGMYEGQINKKTREMSEYIDAYLKTRLEALEPDHVSDRHLEKLALLNYAIGAIAGILKTYRECDQKDSLNMIMNSIKQVADSI